jgi:hypothetical protein
MAISLGRISAAATADDSDARQRRMMAMLVDGGDSTLIEVGESL